MGLMDLLDRLVLVEIGDLLENLVLLDQMVLQEFQVPWDFQGLKVQQEMMALKVILVRMVDKDLLDHLDHQVLLAHQCCHLGWEEVWLMANQKDHKMRVKRKAQKKRHHQMSIHFSKSTDTTLVIRQRSQLKLN